MNGRGFVRARVWRCLGWTGRGGLWFFVLGGVLGLGDGQVLATGAMPYQRLGR